MTGIDQLHRSGINIHPYYPKAAIARRKVEGV